MDPKEIPYQNREIDHFMNEFNKRMTHQDGILDRINSQTMKTNGRVNKHSLQFKIMWTIVCATGAVVVFLGPFMYHLILDQIQRDFQDSQTAIESSDKQYIQQSVNKSVSDVLETYNIKVKIDNN